MKISFVVPTFNRAATIGSAVSSILRQPYPDREILVVDDGSTDDTANVLRQFVGDGAVRLIVLPTNRGQNVARNAGISRSTGEVVTILDSDDEDLGRDLSPVVEIFRTRPEIGIVFTGVVSRSTGRPLGRMDAAGKTFGHEGFVDGTYRGEYQPFLRRAYLECPVFEEGLGIRRSCTLLTWLRLGRQFKCTILELPTRLYGDSQDDRMSDRANALRDSHEIARCYQLLLARYGSEVAEINPRTLARMVGRRCYYDLLSHGRSSAREVLHRGEASRVDMLTRVALLALIALGPRVARAVTHCALRTLDLARVLARRDTPRP